MTDDRPRPELGSEQVFATPGDPERPSPRAATTPRLRCPSAGCGPAERAGRPVGEAEGCLTRPSPDEHRRAVVAADRTTTPPRSRRGGSPRRRSSSSPTASRRRRGRVPVPAPPDDTFGFVPTSVPRGLEEDVRRANPTVGARPSLVAEDRVGDRRADGRCPQTTGQARATHRRTRARPAAEGAVRPRPARRLVAGRRRGSGGRLVWQPQDGRRRRLEVTRRRPIDDRRSASAASRR